MSTGRTEKEQVRVHIRWMIRRDMPEVLQTEQESFEFAWTEEDFLRCLRQRNCIGMVAEQGEKVVGFMIYELHKSKLHILNCGHRRLLSRRRRGRDGVRSSANCRAIGGRGSRWRRRDEPVASALPLAGLPAMREGGAITGLGEDAFHAVLGQRARRGH
jgi:hypothetical protein